MANRIEGLVLSADWSGVLVGVTVYAQSTNGYPESSAVTDSNGWFIIANLTDKKWAAKLEDGTAGNIVLVPENPTMIDHSRLGGVEIGQHHPKSHIDDHHVGGFQALSLDLIAGMVSGTGHGDQTGEAAAIHAHDELTAGTIAAHDTGATGTELDTLTDGSDADALHAHPGRASIALDNLASVAINTSLISDTNDTDDLGSAATAWRATYTNLLDLQGTADALILDDDGDTTISAPTDDQIDFEIGGADVFVMKAAGLLFHESLTVTGGAANIEAMRLQPTYSPDSGSPSMWSLRGMPIMRPDGAMTVKNLGLESSALVNAEQLTDGESATVSELVGAIFKPNATNFANAVTLTLDVTFMKGIDIKPNIFWGEIFGGSALGGVDDYIGIHLQRPNSADLVNYVGLEIDAETAATGFIYGIYQLGVGMENRLVSNLNIFGADATPVATVDVVQDSSTGAQPVLRLKQDDDSEEFIRYHGSATSADLTKSIVDNGDVSTATLAGWAKVFVTDDGNQIADQAYYQPLYTLA